MKKAKRFTVVEMAGTHYEMGRQYGLQCKELIRRLVQDFEGLILEAKNIQRGREVAHEAVAHVRECAPELLEEVEGIASGAGVDFEDVFRINCSVELFAWQGCLQGVDVSTVPRECSSFAARAKEGPLAAWNMDWWRLWLPYIVLLKGRPKQGPRFLAFAFAGCVGRPGMGEHLALGANYLPYRNGREPGGKNPTWEGPGVPYNFFSRMLLKQPSTKEALRLIASVRRMASVNYTLADKHGSICCVETTPRDYDVLPAPEGFIVHANSYHSPKFGGIPEDKQKEQDPRAYHARQLFRERRGHLDRHAIVAIQTSHFPGKTTGICVHQPLQNRDGITLLSFIADVAAGTMWAACGPPCEHEFLPYEL